MCRARMRSPFPRGGRRRGVSVAGDVLEFALGAVFDFLPLAAADAVDFGWHALFAAVFGELVERVNRYEQYVVVAVYELYHLFASCR